MTSKSTSKSQKTTNQVDKRQWLQLEDSYNTENNTDNRVDNRSDTDIEDAFNTTNDNRVDSRTFSESRVEDSNNTDNRIDNRTETDIEDAFNTNIETTLEDGSKLFNFEGAQGPVTIDSVDFEVISEVTRSLEKTQENNSNNFKSMIAAISGNAESTFNLATKALSSASANTIAGMSQINQRYMFAGLAFAAVTTFFALRKGSN